MSPPVLTNFKEHIVDLPDKKKLTVHVLTPVSNDDSFRIPRPTNRIEGSSTVGFLNDTTGGTIAAGNFYVGSTDSIQLTNRKDQKVVIATLNSGNRRNFIPESEF